MSPENPKARLNDEALSSQCKETISVARHYRDEIPAIVSALVDSCNAEGCFDHVGPEPIPSRDAIVNIINRICRILYPGYFIRQRVDRVNVGYYFGQELTSLYEELSEQIMLAVRHDCIRNNLSCSHCEERGHRGAIDFIKTLPDLRKLLATDIRHAYEGDPAATSFDEIIFSYPGLYAITIYRIAHHLYHLNVPMLPRIMTEYGHSKTGIDIHPKAHIGESFFIDHGTGVVIGETTIIGDRVRLYQGVTLGALSLSRSECEGLRNQKRHPTIEDDVIIYANATVLGGNTFIGARSVIGGNVWITHSVPPDTEVFIKKQDLIFGSRHLKEQAAKECIANPGKEA
ncbi:MAG: serine acetyltransferase [Syntrophaceae bacterium]|nr:serine acetyltransferase [Syntrophaceae bacterium]